MIPAAPHHAAVGEHAGIDVVALVVGDLMQFAAVGLHDMQHERGLVQVLGLPLEFRLALIQQHRAGVELARGCEQDASIRKIVRGDVLRAGAGRVRGRQYGVQVVGRHHVFPDIPVRRIPVLLLWRQRAAHRENDLAAVAGDVDILQVVERALRRLAGHARGDIDLAAAGGGGIEQIQVGLGNECAAQPQVILRLRDGALDVGDTEVGGLRVRRLRIGNGHRSAATAVGAAADDQCCAQQCR